MKYLGTILVAYIVLFILDIMQKRNHKTTKSLNKFSIRTISDVSFICAIGALFLLGVLIWGFWSEPEKFYSKRYLMIIIPLHIAKLNGRLCGTKRPHSVSEQPNFYQSLQSNPYNDSSHPSGGE